VQVTEPVSFDGNAARNWQEFEEQLKWFVEGSECSEKSAHSQGKHAREIYKTLQWAENGDKMKFNNVQKVFRVYCQLRKNIPCECHKFWNLQQDEGETVDAYTTRLGLQADYCDYDKEGSPAVVKNKIVQDKFVFGLQDDNLKEHLLREADISLSKIVSLAQRTKSSQQHKREMTDNKSTDTVPFKSLIC